MMVESLLVTNPTGETVGAKVGKSTLMLGGLVLIEALDDSWTIEALLTLLP